MVSWSWSLSVGSPRRRRSGSRTDRTGVDIIHRSAAAATRPRPALSGELRYADDLARELAIDRGLAQPATYFALALIAHGASGLEPSLGGAATAISVGAWLYALASWRGNRRLGLDFVMANPQPAALAT